MTDQQKASRNQMAAIGAMLGLMIYRDRIDAAKASERKEDLTEVTEELGKFILDMVGDSSDGNQL